MIPDPAPWGRLLTAAETYRRRTLAWVCVFLLSAALCTLAVVFDWPVAAMLAFAALHFLGCGLAVFEALRYRKAIDSWAAKHQ